jgi:hypothetical protein
VVQQANKRNTFLVVKRSLLPRHHGFVYIFSQKKAWLSSLSCRSGRVSAISCFPFSSRFLLHCCVLALSISLAASERRGHNIPGVFENAKVSLAKHLKRPLTGKNCGVFIWKLFLRCRWSCIIVQHRKCYLKPENINVKRLTSLNTV